MLVCVLVHLLPRAVWIGALTGVAISIVIGVVFIVLFYVAGSKIFTGNSQVRDQGMQWG